MKYPSSKFQGYVLLLALANTVTTVVYSRLVTVENRPIERSPIERRRPIAAPTPKIAKSRKALQDNDDQAPAPHPYLQVPDSPPVVGPDAILSHRTVAELGVSQQDALLLQSAITSLDERLLELATANTTEITDQIDGNSKLDYFQISSFLDQREAALAECRKAFHAVLDDQRTDTLFEQMLAGGSKLSDLGAFDIIVGFKDIHRLADLRAHYTVIDPVAGVIVDESELPYSNFRRRFGIVFEVINDGKRKE